MIRPNYFQRLPVGDKRFQLILNYTCCVRIGLDSYIYVSSESDVHMYDWVTDHPERTYIFGEGRRRLPVTLREQI
jgi:hypothetical protein